MKTAEVLTFPIQPERIVANVEVRAYNLLDLWFDGLKLCLRLGGWI